MNFSEVKSFVPITFAACILQLQGVITDEGLWFSSSIQIIFFPFGSINNSFTKIIFTKSYWHGWDYYLIVKAPVSS